MYRRRQRFGLLFVAPFALVFLLFLVLPLGYAFWTSLQTKTLLSDAHFTGIGNYITAFSDPLFLSGVWLVIRFCLVSIPIQILTGLAAALVIDGVKNRLARVSRLVIFLPYAVPAVIGTLMWGFLYSPGFGPVKEIFALFSAQAPLLLGPQLIFASLVNIVTWQWAGYYMIIIFTALQGIDPTLYEAARVDGASAWQIAWRIKLPLVAPALVLILVFSLIGTLQFFTEPQVLRPIAAGALIPSYTPNMYAYTLAFSYNQLNYAAAISFALAVIVFISAYLFLLVNRRRGGLAD
jgi:multiple sugar transport system permease protein